ncbi:Pyridoxal 5'-phosphate synthase subunit snz1 [Thoreauomyces humboldtii]|nr:Pyridoxal 5'-phosphate synthase subunit snz1 [Thoreauomyces humboldtii]
MPWEKSVDPSHIPPYRIPYVPVCFATRTLGFRHLFPRHTTMAFSAPSNLVPQTNGATSSTTNDFIVKAGLAQNLKVKKGAGSTPLNLTHGVRLPRSFALLTRFCPTTVPQGGVIMDVINAEQARIAEEAGACAVMALERVPADIRRDGGVSRMSDPKMIKEIIAAVTIPVMAKVRIGHFVEAQIIEHLNVDYIDESEVLTMADEVHHIEKSKFKVPFVCGAKNLGEALRRINEGASMIRTKGEAGTGDVVQAVRHARQLLGEIRKVQAMADDELYVYAKDIQAPYHLVKEVKRLGRLPVVNFAAGGVATPADAALMMQLGMDGVFVGSGIFKSGDPAKRARAIVQAVTHYQDASVLAKVSEDLGEPMVGIGCDHLVASEKFADRGN